MTSRLLCIAAPSGNVAGIIQLIGAYIPLNSLYNAWHDIIYVFYARHKLCSRGTAESILKRGGTSKAEGAEDVG